MKRLREAFGAKRGIYSGALSVILLAASVIHSNAQIISARNTSLQANLTGGFSAGLTDWTINGVNELQEQWFYYSVGNGPVASIDSISAPSAPVTTTGNVPTLTTTYANSTLSVTAGFSLQSQPLGSPRASLATSITLDNTASTTQTFHFYQYSDFSLGGLTGGQSVQFFNPSPQYEVLQSGNGGSLTGLLTAVSGGTGDTVEEQAGLFNGQRFGLTNGTPVTLNNTLTAGPGNVNFAYEIDATLAPGTSLTISELQTVPEPSTLALIAPGVLALFCGRRLVSFKKS